MTGVTLEDYGFCDLAWFLQMLLILDLSFQKKSI